MKLNKNINILRLSCLIKDRDGQDLIRTVLSIIFDIFYDNGNQLMNSNELFDYINNQFSLSIDKDFYENLLSKSESFELQNTNGAPLVKLTSEKYDEIDKNISDFYIEPYIVSFLKSRTYDLEKKNVIVEILIQSIYENIYSFNPENISSLITANDDAKYNQDDIDIFNEFLEIDEPNKNRCLYNHFAKAIEFAIITSGRGVSKFTEDLFKNKRYLLDTNIIFRLLGVGGPERQKTIKKLIQICRKQGIIFEYSYQTIGELNKRLEQCVIDLSRAETSKKIDITETILKSDFTHFNDDFITQYCFMKLSRQITSPEGYELEMKTKFKNLCDELGIEISKVDVKINEVDRRQLAEKLQKKKKEVNEFYRYSHKQAIVDAHNIIYVDKIRGANNYNYSEIKSFYLSTDRSLHKILSNNESKAVPQTILPSQLFVIHNILSANDIEPDYDVFFKFLKKRNSQFKLRGRDIFNYINQAREFSNNDSEISNLIATFSDQRYNYSKSSSVDEGVLISFKDFAQTTFDKKTSELEEMKRDYSFLINNADNDLNRIFSTSNYIARAIDVIITFIVIPSVALLIKQFKDLDLGLVILIILISEIIKFYISTRTNVLKKLWEKIFIFMIKKTAFYKLSHSEEYVRKGVLKITEKPDNIWK